MGRSAVPHRCHLYALTVPGSADDRLFFKPLTQQDERALFLVKERPGITVTELSEELGVSAARARKIVGKLGNRLTVEPAPLPADPKADAWINAMYYEQRPWEHFDRRLVALAASFGQADRWHALMSSPTTIGPLKIHADAPRSAEAQQSHLGEVAIQSVVLLHHGAETLLRGIHAHGPARADAALPTCPALTLARMRDFRKFKIWVQTILVDDEAELRRYVRSTLGDDDRNDRIAVVSGYVRRLARFFLDADAYNAAKHGLALTGAHSQLTVTVGDLTFADARGVAITWLDDRGARPRRITCWYSLAGLIGLTHACGRLLQQLWMVAQRRYLGAEREMLWQPQPIGELWGSLDIDDVLLLKMEWGSPER